MPGGQRQRRQKEVSGPGGRQGCLWNALRPKRAKLAECRRLRGVVERKLEAKWSPQQISAWLALEYPYRPEMQVSHETIYRSLFVQSRGALRKELHSCLRGGRAMRRAKAYTKGNVGRGQLKNMVMISERPAEVKNRAVPGHWEGDLIFGKKMTSIGTLVERHSRHVILLKLPNGHVAHLDPARPTAPLRHLGSGQGDGGACPLHGRDRCTDLLLRPQEPLAARQQREHQRPASPVSPPKSSDLS
jgi:transposase, IS30 family